MVVESGKRHCFCAGSNKYSLDILLRQIIFSSWFSALSGEFAFRFPRGNDAASIIFTKLSYGLP
jgi:hypothetical protein